MEQLLPDMDQGHRYSKANSTQNPTQIEAQILGRSTGVVAVVLAMSLVLQERILPIFEHYLLCYLNHLTLVELQLLEIGRGLPKQEIKYQKKKIFKKFYLKCGRIFLRN